MSSQASNKERALRLLSQNNSWKLSTTGKSSLFIQANHPDLINEFTEILMSLIKNNDTLIDMVGKVNLEDYIQSQNKNF